MKRFTKLLIIAIMIAWGNVAFSVTNTECTGTDTQKQDGNDFTLGYNYSFTTSGTDVTINFELLDSKVGLVAYLWNRTSGFSESSMTNSSGQIFTKTLTGQTPAATITVAVKFAFAGGLSVTKDFTYTVGNTCVADAEAPTLFTATKGTVTSSSVELLLNATDNSGNIKYTITYGTTTLNTTGTSAVQKSYIVSGLTPETAYSFSVVAKDAAGNAADNNPIEIAATTSAVPAITEAPVPTSIAAPKVISIFSDAFTSISGTNFNPGWGQATTYTAYQISGNNTIKYANLNYQGIAFGSDVFPLGMKYLHIDVWTPDETSLKIYPICKNTSTGANEPEKFIQLTPINLNTWNSYDIPLTDFTSQGLTMTDVYQIKIVGSNGKTINIDNLYFWDDDASADAEAPSAFTATAGTITYNSVEIILNATDNKKIINYEITYGTTTLNLNAPSGISKTVSINSLTSSTDYTFSVNAKDATGNEASNSPISIPVTTKAEINAAPTPTFDATKVISIFSGAYTDVTGTNFNPGWGQSTVVTTESIKGNPTLQYANFNYQGIQLSGSVDASSMTKLHVDIYTANETSIRITPISPGHELSIALNPLNLNSWNSYDIPLSSFTGVVMSNIQQFKFDAGTGKTLLIDNLYFYDNYVNDLEVAKTAAGALTAADYVDFTAVTTALDLPETNRTEMVTKANSINSAIASLVNLVNDNLAKAKAAEALLSAADYIDYSAVVTAIALAESTKDEKIAKTNALNTAIAALVTIVDDNLAKAKVAESLLNATDYTDYTAVTNALTNPETTNGEKIAKTNNINAAIAALVTKIDDNLAKAKAAEALLNAVDYLDYSTVTAALVLSETNNTEKIAKTTAINSAISALVTIVDDNLAKAKAAAALLVASDYADFTEVATALALSELNNSDKISKTNAIKSAIDGLEVSVKSITLNSAALNLYAAGVSSTIVPTVLPSNAANKNVTWSSSDVAIASVNSNGVVTPLAEGSVTITATTEDKGFSATCTVTVAPAQVTSVSVLPTTLNLTTGGNTSTLEATILPIIAGNKNITWTSNNTAVATIDASGIVSPVSAGNATISVTTVDGNYTATCFVTVTDEPVSGISISPITMHLASGGATGTINPTISPANATNKSINWTSSDNSIATVNASGVVTPITVGTATITAETVDGSKTATCEVIVSATEVHITAISIEPTTMNLIIGGSTSTIVPTITPLDATNTNVTWTTSDAAIATVSSSGVVSPIGVGSANITATTADGAKTATCAVTVAPIHVIGISVLPVTLNLTAGGSTSALVATISPSNATNKSVTFSSSEPSIASVNTSGVITPLSAGSATITVTTVDGSKTATCAVNVIATVVAVTGINVQPATMNLKVGGSAAQIDATIAPSNASNRNISYSSSNTSIATVSSTGFVTAVSNGNATITVTTADGGKTATCSVVVTTPVTGVTLDNTAITLTAGGNASAIIATISPATASNKNVTYSSSDKAIATISSEGLVTPIAAGNVTITVTTIDGEKIATCSISVIAETVSVTGISLDKSELNLILGGSNGTLVATIAPENASNKKLTYSSSDDAIATITDNGVITPVAAGTTTITATSIDGEKTATCLVTVSKETSIDKGFEEIVTFYPNPSNGVFNIQNKALALIVITDINGKVVLEKNINGSEVIDISSQPTGVYCLQLRTYNKTSFSKIVVK